MRRGACLLLLLLGPQVAGAGEVPDPVFWAGEADFLEQVGEAQFVDRLELHLLQYAADPGWRAEWAARRYSGNGLLGEYGSTTGTELYVRDQIALDLFPAERFQIRYDRRQFRDGRFDVSDERLDALWYAGPALAVALSGMPTFEKEYASVGLGLRVGAPRARSALELRLLNERFVWNDKTDGQVRFGRRPLRLLLDGFVEAGRWRVHGSVDLGLEWDARDRGTGRSAAGFQRFADVEAGWASGDLAAGARLTGAVLRREERDPAGAALLVDRAWGRAVLWLRRDLGRWSASALLGWAYQGEDFSSPAEPDGRYVQDAILLGIEGGVRASRGLVLRVGYLAASQRARRTAAVAAPLPARVENAYLDKAHVRATYEFGPGMAIEALLSQALRGGAFGGGSVRALFVL